jgi:hypothetical protein
MEVGGTVRRPFEGEILKKENWPLKKPPKNIFLFFFFK